MAIINNRRPRDSAAQASSGDIRGKIKPVGCSCAECDNPALPTGPYPAALLEGHQERSGASQDGPRQTEERDADPTLLPEVVAMSTKRRFAAMAGLCLIFTLVAMAQITASAVLPAIGNEFGAMSAMSWSSTAYTLSMAACQVLCGQLCDIFGRTPILMLSLLAFLVGSVLCGASRSMGWLVAGRVAMGAGTGGVTSAVTIVISDLTTVRERGKYLSVTSFAWLIANSAGPSVGGIIAQKGGWRWCFYMNLPIGAAASFLTLVILRAPPQAVGEKGHTWLGKLKRVDFLGSLAVVVSMTLILLGLSWGGTTFPWDSPTVITLLVAGVVVLGLFVAVEVYVAKEPVVDIGLFRNPTTAAALMVNFATNFGLGVVFHYLPILFAAIFNDSDVETAIKITPYLASVAVFSFVCGHLMSVLGFRRPLLVAGAAVCVVGYGVLTLIRPQSSLGEQLGYQVLSGAGVGLVFPSSLVIAQVSAGPRLTAVTVAIVLFLRAVGSVVGVAVSSVVFYNTLWPRLEAMAADTHYRDYRDAIVETKDDVSATWSAGVPPEVRQQVIHVYYTAFRRIFMILIPVLGVSMAASLVTTGPNACRPAADRQKEYNIE